MALEDSFSPEQMAEETAARIRKRAKLCPCPPHVDCSRHIKESELSIAYSDFEHLLYATTVHFKHPLVTRNHRLAAAVKKRGIKVGSMATILQELVKSEKLESADAMKMITGLATRQDFLLGMSNPSAHDFKKHKFPV